MKRWVRRCGIYTAIIAIVGVLTASICVWLWNGQPAWYPTKVASDAERRAAADEAERQLTNVSNWANRQRALEDRRAYARASGATAPATAPADQLTVSFTQEELAAFLDKWSVMYDWPSKYSEFVTDPAIVLQKGRIILAGKVKDMAAITSLHFEPSLDEGGKLNLKLVSVQAGRLPLPRAAWSSWREKLVEALRGNLPHLQRSAKIEPNGATNVAAMSAAFSEMLLDAAADKSTDAVLFLPLLDKDRSVPVKLTSITIDDGALTVTVVQMTSAERAQLLDRIKNPPEFAEAHK